MSKETKKSKKSDGGKWFNNIARLIKSKKGTYFLVFGRPTDKEGNRKGESPFPITINEGDIFPAKLKREQLDRLVDEGIISAEAADRIAAIEKFEIDLPPRDSKPAEKKPAKQETESEDDENIF